jgi:hypothetical protein
VKLVSHDLIQDLTLRALSVVVLTSLVACLSFLVVRPFWLQHVERVEVEEPVVTVSLTQDRPAASRPAPVERPEVLMNPGFIYRCVERGKVGYSDRPCTLETPGRSTR